MKTKQEIERQLKEYQAIREEHKHAKRETQGYYYYIEAYNKADILEWVLNKQ